LLLAFGISVPLSFIRFKSGKIPNIEITYCYFLIMKKILILYYTRTGNTEEMAKAVAEGAKSGPIDFKKVFEEAPRNKFDFKIGAAFALWLVGEAPKLIGDYEVQI
jgi:hypothetical protein